MRTVVVGDVHGCRRELEALLSLARFSPGQDRLVFVGDLVVRGPEPHEVLALVSRLGAQAVRGNHESRLLAVRGREGSSEHEQLAAELSEDEWKSIEAMPLWVDLPEHGIRVVHAGLVPGQSVDETPAETLLTIRSIDESGRPSASRGRGAPWGERYMGPPHVLFGHNALEEPQLHPWATGIDTGCVYGGRLTAVVLHENEPMPRGRDALAVLASVPAFRAYVRRAAG